jgi:hypothetical protein
MINVKRLLDAIAIYLIAATIMALLVLGYHYVLIPLSEWFFGLNDTIKGIIITIGFLVIFPIIIIYKGYTND